VRPGSVVETQVTLADGHQVSLGDLPLRWADRRPYTADPLFAFTYDGKPSATSCRLGPFGARADRSMQNVPNTLWSTAKRNQDLSRAASASSTTISRQSNGHCFLRTRARSKLPDQQPSGG